MLRMLFGEPPRIPEGKLLQTMQSMERFVDMLHKRIADGRDQDHKLRKIEIWSLGLLSSLNELEQSQYAAQQFAARVKSQSLQDMSTEERVDYQRHVYYDKNAFIRLFALLDKLGTLMNEFLGLQTERIKPHFSYFTVLRTMRVRNVHVELMGALNDLKDKNKDVLSRLRKRRNTEIHYMNSELQDDLRQSYESYGGNPRLENLQKQCDDLAQGVDMVLETLRLTFNHACSQLKKRK
ncbi:hypothetical protein K0T92_06625 [Paenibacillus oenotherae]|uniref:Cthe-2314-like HEPN domain-containing protein n=1 Tax=Paenibacillus oenotherae TaxID=1435645 RepID=A0ABS7D3H6_9BACL|nr:Cthe_2314 family HEPN domain-containing protein [Paenibacillus oenotherae]MBW7474414.1 hypothetical protein [Paenibacillus oenotherae]